MFAKTDQPVTETFTPTLNRPRRILYVDHTAALGGGEVALLNLVQHLDRSRYEPVVVLFEGGPLVDRLREARIETHLLPIANSVMQTRKESLKGVGLLRMGALFGVARQVSRVARFIRAGQFDLIQTNSLKSDIIGGLAARMARRPLLWHVRDRIDSDYLPRPAVAAFRAACAIVPDFLAANSSATLELIRPAFARSLGDRAARERLRVIHDGVTADAFVEPRPTQRDPAQPNIVNIGLVGRIAQWKGQAVFIRAAAQVLAQYPNCRFKIIGAPLFSEQEYEKEIRRLVLDLKLESAVEFTGFRADVAQAIAELDILVHASVTAEPFGQVIIEGMAAGKPVIATRGGGVPEIVADGVTGLLVPMGEADAMARAICRLLADPGAAGEMGRRGRERVSQHFRIEETARKFEAFYEEIFSLCQDARSSVGAGRMRQGAALKIEN